MKKIILAIAFFSMIAIPAMAQISDNCYYKYCAPKPYNLSSHKNQITSNVTGMTFFAEQVAQHIIKKELKKATKEKFRVEMKSYSLVDLMGGKFKALKISGRNLDIEGVYLTSFETHTVCDFNYIKLDNKTIKFRENMVMDYAIEISNVDLEKTVKSKDYLDMLNNTKLSAFGITFFKLDGADVQIKNSKLYFTINVTSPLSAKPIPIMIRSDLKVEEGKIVLTKIDLVNMLTVIDLSKITYLMNVLNPLTFSIDILNNKDSKMSVRDVNIIGDRIFVKGNILIPKNVK